MMTKQLVKEYVLENINLGDLVQEMNSWNGAFDELNYYENDEYFFQTFYDNNPMEAVRAAYYGNYNYCDEYVTFDAYGNLKSANGWQIEEELKDNIDDIINELLYLAENNELNYFTLDNELLEMLEELVK